MAERLLLESLVKNTKDVQSLLTVIDETYDETEETFKSSWGFTDAEFQGYKDRYDSLKIKNRNLIEGFTDGISSNQLLEAYDLFALFYPDMFVKIIPKEVIIGKAHQKTRRNNKMIRDKMHTYKGLCKDFINMTDLMEFNASEDPFIDPLEKVVKYDPLYQSYVFGRIFEDALTHVCHRPVPSWISEVQGLSINIHQFLFALLIDSKVFTRDTSGYTTLKEEPKALHLFNGIPIINKDTKCIDEVYISNEALLLHLKKEIPIYQKITLYLILMDIEDRELTTYTNMVVEEGKDGKLFVAVNSLYEYRKDAINFDRTRNTLKKTPLGRAAIRLNSILKRFNDGIQYLINQRAGKGCQPYKNEMQLIKNPNYYPPIENPGACQAGMVRRGNPGSPVGRNQIYRSIRTADGKYAWVHIHDVPHSIMNYPHTGREAFTAANPVRLANDSEERTRVGASDLPYQHAKGNVTHSVTAGHRWRADNVGNVLNIDLDKALKSDLDADTYNRVIQDPEFDKMMDDFRRLPSIEDDSKLSEALDAIISRLRETSSEHPVIMKIFKLEPPLISLEPTPTGSPGDGS